MQVSHEVLPPVDVNDPAGQSSHILSEKPVWVVCFPASQEVQIEDPDGENEPTGQSRQSESAVSLYFPTPHELQKMAPAVEVVSTAHSVQEVAPVEIMYVPA